MKTLPANVLIVLDEKGNEIGLIKGKFTYELNAPLQDEEIASLLMNNGDRLPLVQQGLSEKDV